MEKNLLKKLDIKIVILSRGRADTITTHELLPEYIEVVVPDDEVDKYKEKINNPIVPIPSELKGLGYVRNWVLNHFKEETVIMLDDDITVMYYLGYELSKRITDPETIMQVLVNNAVMAKDLGVHCFGFSQVDIRKYNPTEPFNLCTWVGGVIGVIGRKYEFRNDKFKVDIDYCLQNLLVDRIIWVDNRYTFTQKRDCNTGGNSLFRTNEEYNKSVETLKEKWGDYIKVKNEYSSQISIKLNVKRRQKIEYE